ncbi:hypothetical protein [Streptomyces sp. NBC_01456]|uniref:hypothetical protein n=1 Tax=Streptomyces sp. NBC_01456 TaxID=2975868 RepID=UPI002E368E21|nr:hypothetical protein [Streptomyces sp. NBC_01456]
MIRDLIFAEIARTQFDALARSNKADVGAALLRITQEANTHGVWRAEDDRHLAVTYEVRPTAIVVTEISTAQPRPAGSRQPYQGMEVRHEGSGRWSHLNPHEE